MGHADGGDHRGGPELVTNASNFVRGYDPRSASSAQVAWSKTGRGSYMPTPLAYRGIVYVLANNGVFDAYELETGTDLSSAPAAGGQRLQRVAGRGRREDLPVK